MKKRWLLALPALLVGAAGAQAAGTAQAHRRMAQDLWQAAPAAEGAYQPDQLEGLPAPVARYLAHVLTPGQPVAGRARLAQEGEMRLYPNERWLPFTAVQHVTADPPGFVWDARVQMMPLAGARVVDAYSGGQGYLRARLLGVLTVAEGGPDPATNTGEMMRYLAETPWLPTALLPGRGVEWTALDDHRAIATLSDGSNTVSLTFTFNDADEVEGVYAEARPRTEDESAPWSGRFWGYEEVDGMRVPLSGEVTWHLPEGDFPYWRGRITPEAYLP